MSKHHLHIANLLPILDDPDELDLIRTVVNVITTARAAGGTITGEDFLGLRQLVEDAATRVVRARVAAGDDYGANCVRHARVEFLTWFAERYAPASVRRVA